LKLITGDDILYICALILSGPKIPSTCLMV
jgi:hypothetical protein